MMRRKGFTLVELLVVIGIIAVLIGILLPALNAARRQAGAVKCAAALREMGNVANMYAIENKGYYPPLRANGSAYNIDGNNFAAGRAYFFNFMAKYVTKTKLGYSATTSEDATQALRSIFWSCPAWNGYNIYGNALNPGGIYVAQTGYGWNAFPEFTAQFPAMNEELGETTPAYVTYADTPTSTDNWKTFTNKWYKQKAWTLPAERALAGDATFYVLESRPPNTDMSNTVYGQGLLSPSLWVGAHGANQNTYDMYRHGKVPPVDPANNTSYTADGGKVAFNTLFADGHVAMQTDKASAYRTVRMRFPG